MTNRHARFTALLLGTTAACAVLSAPAFAAEEQRQRFDIRAQDAAAALNEYARQAGVQIVFPYDHVRGRQTPAVEGDLTRQEALALLTDGMGLAVTSDRAGMVTLRDAADPQSGSAAGDGAGTVEALIVTAQKREEDIQDVPIAISAFSQEDLTRSQVAGGPDLMTQVPNMTFTKTNFSSYSVQLRGIGTQAISATTDPAVAVAFNNTPFIRNRFFEQEFYDLQRIEVLRGPQGTLYGRNATAGVVNIISQKPKFIAESKLSGDVSNFNSSRLEGMVNIPLVEDKVALRVAGAWTKRDGYATNEITGNPIDGRDLWSTRLSLRFAPTDAIDVNLIWEHFEEDDDRIRSGKQLCKKDEVTSVGEHAVQHRTLWVNRGNDGLRSGVQAQMSQGCTRVSLYSPEAFQTPNGAMIPYYLPLGAVFLPEALDEPYTNATQSRDLRVIESTVDPEYRATADLFELQATFDITDAISMTSETSYSRDFIFSTQDYNRFNTASGAWEDDLTPGFYYREGVLEDGVFCDPQIGCADRLVAVDLSTAPSTQFSQELRLASDFDGPFNFSFGANYLRYDTEEKYYVFVNSLSLFAAVSPYGGPGDRLYSPYVGGVTDNSECLRSGPIPPDPDLYALVISCTYIDPNPIDNLNDKGHNYFLSKNPYKLISYAAFGEAYYNITDNLKVTGGLRWTVDKKEAPRIPSWILASQTVGYPVEEVVEQEWREPTGRLTVDWKPDLAFTDETLVYASYAHGYKAGGANPPLPGLVLYGVDPAALDTALEESATHPRTFDAEFLDAFELGAKNTILDGHMTLNLAAFYYDYKNYQISEIVNRSALNRNFDAEVWGVELEADWRPLENLRLGFKGGYQNTRIADGEEAIDLMDRTAGDPDWIILRPFPTYPSSCILPTSMFARSDGVYKVGNLGGGGMTGCELAYLLNYDPVTEAPYQPNQTYTAADGFRFAGFTADEPYTGFNPETAPNGGEGIMKPVGGNELPNAPNWTATITADYTVPLGGEWLATLHTDLHWQAESWWRVFQDHEFARLDEYFTMNLAAIFTNEAAGWNVMAYVKNVTDETAITGAFLNSDDTALTTNVFLTEPRLYGIRVTKAWDGGPLLGSFGERRDGPYPFTLELGGQVQRHDAPYDAVNPSFRSVFPTELDLFDDSQNQDLDWGDAREVKLTWRPPAGAWTASLGWRRGETNGAGPDLFTGVESNPGCAFPIPAICASLSNPVLQALTRTNFTATTAVNREEHELVEFLVGRDFGFGDVQSRLQAGLRHARFDSTTATTFDGVPDWDIPDGWFFLTVPHHRYQGEADASREFEGAGPMVVWDGAFPFLGDEDTGRLALEWSVGGGVLFGKQKTSISGEEEELSYEAAGLEVTYWSAPVDIEVTEIGIARSNSVTVPVADLSLGLAYEVGRIKIGAGYRWERYFDVLDTGYAAEDQADRTIDGPYFKVSLGFGG